MRDAELARNAEPERVSFLTQTTLAVDETNEVVDVLRRRFPQLRGPRDRRHLLRDDESPAVRPRRRAESDVVLVVGSKNSSNSLRLVEVARREGARAYLVDDEGDVDVSGSGMLPPSGSPPARPLPTSSSTVWSTRLRALGPVDVEERTTASESVQFACRAR